MTTSAGLVSSSRNDNGSKRGGGGGGGEQCVRAITLLTAHHRALVADESSGKTAD